MLRLSYPRTGPERFEELERDYLYEESRQRLRETAEFANQQEAKALALVRIAILIIAASGIFGDLQIESLSVQEWGPVTMASIVAMLTSIAVGAIAFRLLHPQEWETGADVQWLAQYSYASERQMKDEVLRVLTSGFSQNREIARKRVEQLVWLHWTVALQTLCVVTVQVLAAVETGGTMD